MNQLRTQVAIIGAGTAGMRAYREAVKATQSILLIESGPYGTTCARVGCMPSKLLIAAAEAASWSERAELFGIHHGERRIDGRAVMRRVREERDRFAGFVVRTVESWPEEHRIRARARFLSDGELELDDGRRIVADRIVIATGSRPNVPPPFEGLGDRLIDNEALFDFEDLPASVAVFGAGVVGLELGQALHRLGTRMALFGRGDLVGPLTDPEVVSAARELFAAEFEFHPDADVTRHARTGDGDGDGDGVEIDQTVDGQTRTHRFDYALVATGRRPNVDGLGLQNTSLALDDRGVPVYDHHTGRCGESAIFIAGDANNRLPLLHEAADEGFIAGYNAAHFPDVRRFSGSAPLTVLFTDPQIMMVGETHRALVERDAPFATGSVDWSGQGRARVMGVNHGLLRVYGDLDSGKFLGAEMVGPAAEHIAHLLAWARQSELTVGAMLERPFYHPVLEEGVRSALRDLHYNMRMGPKPPPRCLDCGPGG